MSTLRVITVTVKAQQPQEDYIMGGQESFSSRCRGLHCPIGKTAVMAQAGSSAPSDLSVQQGHQFSRLRTYLQVLGF